MSDGFAQAVGDYWVMMDADLSHRPEDLPGLLAHLADADIVVGSRYIPGGGVVNWPLWRRVVRRGQLAAVAQGGQPRRFGDGTADSGAARQGRA